MSAQATHLLQPQVRQTHRAWYFLVAAVVIAAAVAIALVIARPTSPGSTGTTGTHTGPAVSQVGGPSQFQYKPLP